MSRCISFKASSDLYCATSWEPSKFSEAVLCWGEAWLQVHLHWNVTWPWSLHIASPPIHHFAVKLWWLKAQTRKPGSWFFSSMVPPKDHSRFLSRLLSPALTPDEHNLRAEECPEVNVCYVPVSWSPLIDLKFHSSGKGKQKFILFFFFQREILSSTPSSSWFLSLFIHLFEDIWHIIFHLCYLLLLLLLFRKKHKFWNVKNWLLPSATDNGSKSDF